MTFTLQGHHAPSKNAEQHKRSTDWMRDEPPSPGMLQTVSSRENTVHDASSRDSIHFRLKSLIRPECARLGESKLAPSNFGGIVPDQDGPGEVQPQRMMSPDSPRWCMQPPRRCTRCQNPEAIHRLAVAANRAGWVAGQRPCHFCTDQCVSPPSRARSTIHLAPRVPLGLTIGNQSSQAREITIGIVMNPKPRTKPTLYAV